MAKSYSDKLLDPKWQKKRLQILNRDEFTCEFCKDTETTLHVHHKKYSKGNPWDINDDDLITLCSHCHMVEEYRKVEFVEWVTEKSYKKQYDDFIYFTLFLKNTNGDNLFAIFQIHDNSLTYVVALTSGYILMLNNHIKNGNI